jgi:hypothetical protein
MPYPSRHEIPRLRNQLPHLTLRLNDKDEEGKEHMQKEHN